MMTYEELFREMKKCKNNKEVNELLDKFLEQDLELNPLEEEILDVMDTNFKHKLK